MANISDILRRSSVIDTSGSEPPRAIQMVSAMGGGVYTQVSDNQDQQHQVLVGRLSLGVLAAFVLGAVGFYVWTNGIQGGG